MSRYLAGVRALTPLRARDQTRANHPTDPSVGHVAAQEARLALGEADAARVSAMTPPRQWNDKESPSHMDSLLLDGRVAWVTGAGRGLGAAIAQGLAAAGATVALTARTEPELAETLAKIEADGGRGLVLQADVTDPEQVEGAAAALLDRLGGLDVLVNNAGISPVMTRSEALSLADWQRILEVNLTGAFICSQAAGRHMLAAAGGSIISISSIHGQLGWPRLAAYAASKGGLELLTRTLAVEWADRNVRVNAVAPGYFATEMTAGLRASARSDALLERIPLARFGLPQEVVGAVLFLASDLSSYVTGSTVSVDGGWTALPAGDGARRRRG
jgi:NAD(P)-dependent dehydrogenase (short-subunit alcohol dehydrogenase family)